MSFWQAGPADAPWHFHVHEDGGCDVYTPRRSRGAPALAPLPSALSRVSVVYGGLTCTHIGTYVWDAQELTVLMLDGAVSYPIEHVTSVTITNCS